MDVSLRRLLEEVLFFASAARIQVPGLRDLLDRLVLDRSDVKVLERVVSNFRERIRDLEELHAPREKLTLGTLADELAKRLEWAGQAAAPTNSDHYLIDCLWTFIDCSRELPREAVRAIVVGAADAAMRGLEETRKEKE
ncbi:MAG: hypothetical protein M0R66_06820 [Candidatus Omnitrophica bacterium]|jgi:hypothetical protein|nr:hypothetical protein [Candidatus Omnitrophota bacterium]